MHFYFYTVAFLFFMLSLGAVFHLRHARRLPALVGPVTEPLPGVSVVIAARNESERLNQTLESLLRQVGVDLEIIVANDRSTDGTLQILVQAVARDARIRFTNITDLPPGWLGKCHACHKAAFMARKTWLLFTDADCWMKSDTIIRGIREANETGSDHIALTPGVEPRTLPARAWHIAFLITLSNWFSSVNRKRPGSHFGMGAFNLMKKDAYEKCGGYEKLRLSVVDDVKLGKLLSAAGCKTRAFIGGDDVECHWGRTAKEMVRLMEKNYFAAADFNTFGVCAVLLFMIAMYGGALFGLFSGDRSGWLAAISPFFLSAPALICARRLGWKSAPAFFVPLIFPYLFYSIFNSMKVTLRQGGIRWRDTFYPLAELKKHGVR